MKVFRNVQFFGRPVCTGKTLEKILSNASPPGVPAGPSRPAKARSGPYLGRIRDILNQDKDAPKKQRHTAKLIWGRLKSEGFDGGYTAVKDAVRQLKATGQEVFMPLVHNPGEAQVDFGQAVVNMAGILRKVMFFCDGTAIQRCVFPQDL